MELKFTKDKIEFEKELNNLVKIYQDRLKALYFQIEWFKKELIRRDIWNERCKDYEKDCVNCQFWKLWDDAFIPPEMNATLNKGKSLKKRLESIDNYVEWLKKTDNKTWSKQHKELID